MLFRSRLDRPRREALDLLVLALALTRRPARLPRRIHSPTLDRLPARLGQALHEDLARLAAPNCSTLLVVVAFDGAVDGAGESHAEVHANAVVDGVVERVGVGREIAAGRLASRKTRASQKHEQVGEKSERAEGERNDRGNDVLKEPGRVENRAVATELRQR